MRLIVEIFMKFFVKLYFRLNKDCYCFCIGTKDDNDDFDIYRRTYE